MKKIIGMVMVCFMLLCSCSHEPFDLESSKQKVEDMGYTIQTECKTEEEIANIEKSIISTMKFDGYDTEGLDLHIAYYVRYTIYIKDDYNSVYEAVFFIVFETEEAAKFYYRWSVDERDESSEWKDRIDGVNVISSNNKDVRKAIGGSFK